MSIQHLHDDILLYLSKYLNEKDCLVLTLAGANFIFNILYRNGSTRKGLVITECYFIAPFSWKSIFQQSILPGLITKFDASHVYWLPAESLSHSIMQMVNLEELSIQDTQISLGHLPKLFSCCKKIVKLGFTLVEETLGEYEESDVLENFSTHWMKQGFQKLTHLKIFRFAPNETKSRRDFWLVTLGVLKWCRDCISLLVDITYAGPDPRKDIHYNRGVAFNQFNQVATEVFPHLEWMKLLKTLKIQRRGAVANCKDAFMILCIYGWIVEKSLLPNSLLEQVWIDDAFVPLSLSLNDFTAPLIKSLSLPPYHTNEEPGEELMTREPCRHLEHLSSDKIHRLDNLPDLKYMRGEIDSLNVQELSKFCESHSLLEELHLKLADLYWDDPRSVLWEGNWQLPSLKVLVYCCPETPSKKSMARMIEACPSIQRLHVDIKKRCCPADTAQTIGFFSMIHLEQLTWLTFSGFKLAKGSCLPSITERCTKLERLHLNGDFEAHTLFSSLGKCLPLAVKLRDLRLQWKNGIKSVGELLVFLKAIRKSSPGLKRLVLYAEQNDCLRDPNRPTELEEFLVTFLKEMPELVALCLAGFQFNLRVVESVKRQFVKEVLPTRAAFWCHLGQHLPKENDPSVPKIHCMEIVNPMNWCHSPPNFDFM